MKNLNIKIGALAVVMALGTFTSCQPEEDNLFIEDDISSVKEKELFAMGGCDTNTYAPKDAITGTDYNSSVNTQIDDRSCTYDYKQSSYGSSFNWGGYRLTNADNNTGLQTRMERTTSKVNYSNGKFLQIKSTVRILNAGSVDDNIADNALNDGDGTYIAQVKGKHTNLRTDKGESRDPAIVLFIAKPKRRDGGKGSIIKENGQVKDFKIYAELVKKRGGSGSSGRRMVYITTVKRNRDFEVDIRTEFYTSNGRKRQRVKYTINGVSKTHEISTQNTQSQTAEPVETRIRMGAYRCKGATAEILWKDNLSVFKN
jgi:hypothetical protein